MDLQTEKLSHVFNTFALQLRQNTIIQRFTGFIMLLVFTLSATPKVFFHDMVADHRDGAECILDHKTPVVHNQTFDCDFDDLVVSTPFVLDVELSEEVLNDFIIIEAFDFYDSYSVQLFQNKENRGPPAA